MANELSTNEVSADTGKTMVSCVIPCYNSQDSVGVVVQGIQDVFAEHEPTHDFEIILVNDASADSTLQVIEQLAIDFPNIVAVDLARNFGQQNAIMAGFSQVKGDIVVVLDDDMQCPPSEMFKLIDKLEADNLDIVYASYGHREHAGWRNLGSRFNMWCSRKFSRVPNDLDVNNYFAVRRYVVDNAIKYQNPYPFIDGLLLQSVKTYANVPIDHHAREHGQSNYTLRKLVSQWLNGVTFFSVYPLRVATLLGFALAIIGFLSGIGIIIYRIVDPEVIEGWASLIALQLFIGGLIMLGIGMSGEYIGRIYLSLNHMPQYVIRSINDPRDQFGGNH